MTLKETLKQEQPIFYQILSNCFQSQKIPHAFLLVGKNSQEAAHYIAKSLICENDVLACDKCHECERIAQHNYGDLIYVDGKKESIKKGQIEYIQEQFAKSALEGKAKIYLMENIENSTPEAMNSLLKVLEEPIAGVYAIFTCQNLSRVLPTIQSRCQVIQLLPTQKKALIQKLKDRDLMQDDINVLSELFSTYEECEQYIESELFDELKLEVYHFIEDLYFHRDNLIINVQTHLLKNHGKEKDIIQLFLNMLVLGMKDLFHVKQNGTLTYPSYKGLYEKVDVSLDRIIEQIELILNTEYLFGSNANVLLLMDSMMYRL